MKLGHSRPQPTDATLKLNLRWIPFVCGLLLILQFVFPYRGWVVLGIALGGVWLVGFLWARSLARGLRLSREMRYGWAQVGDRIEERFTAQNKSWMPASWFVVIDHATLPGYDVSRASGVGPQSSNAWRAQDVCTRRGLFTLGPASLRTGDPFGLYSVTVRLASTPHIV